MESRYIASAPTTTIKYSSIVVATLHYNGRDTDPIESQSRDSHLASLLALTVA
jgi:hypothetical protein